MRYAHTAIGDAEVPAAAFPFAQHLLATYASETNLLDRRVPPTYGPTADVPWEGADPTHTEGAAGRR